MSNKGNEFERSDYEQQWGPGESPSYDAIGAAYADVAKHKEAQAFSRHSPEGFDEVLKTASEAESESASGRILAAEAVRLLQAWLDGETLEYLSFPSVWVEYTGKDAPRVQAPGSQWRIKRTPRKVWVAFHESGSMADVRAIEPGPTGSLLAAAEDYIEFEEKLS